MAHQIKLARARRLAKAARYPATYDAMLDYVPEAAVAKLTGAEIAAVVDALRATAIDAKALAAREACAEGAIWDARTQRLREITA